MLLGETVKLQRIICCVICLSLRFEVENGINQKLSSNEGETKRLGNWEPEKGEYPESSFASKSLFLFFFF